MRRYLLALLALLVVMGLSLWGIVSTSPQAGAATTHPASVGPYEFLWYPTYGECLEFGNCWGIKQNSTVFINGQVPNAIYIGGNGNGYQELQAGTGKCLGWNDSMGQIVAQTCTGATWQLWAGTGATDDLIWNDWFEANKPTYCPYGSGYTQAVITGQNEGSNLGLWCPQPGGNPYQGYQKWVLYG